MSVNLTKRMFGPDCYGAYGMADYYEAGEKEEQQGINIVEAAKVAKLKHLVLWYVEIWP
jgi:hypothetical protein